MSTPPSLDLPDGVRRTTIRTSRGTFAALEAIPASGVCEREGALLVPGYTGSKEDFAFVLNLLADRSRRVTAIDMRGQFESAAAADPGRYAAPELGADLLAVMQATGARHLAGHSYGGLIAREAMLAGEQARSIVASVTFMSSGPAALTGPRADELNAMLAAVGADGQELPDAATLRDGVAAVWQTYLEPQALASGTPAPVIDFVRRRMLSTDPVGLVLMARHMLAAPDRTAELAKLAGNVPMLVIYGEDDNAWSPAAQEDMARRLGARRHCIPAAMHSPAVEAPATTASALTQFWDATERATLTHAAVTGTA